MPAVKVGTGAGRVDGRKDETPDICRGPRPQTSLLRRSDADSLSCGLSKSKEGDDTDSMLQNLLAPLLGELTEIRKQYPAEWIGAALSSVALKFLIDRAIAAGVPDGYAEKFGLTPEQAKKIYDATLHAALTRA